MKKLFTILASILNVSLFYAQNDTTVTVNIKLNDIQTIAVNNGINEINLNYSTQSDYENGVSSFQSNHIATFSTMNYFVKSHVTQENVITNNDIYINGILQNVNNQNLFTNNSGNHLYDVTYSAKGSYEYINKNKTTYTLQVVYSIEPQ